MLILRDHTFALDDIRWQRLSVDLFEVFWPAAAGLYRGTVRRVGSRLDWQDGTPVDDYLWQSVMFRLQLDLDAERAGRAPQYRLDAPAELGLIDAAIARCGVRARSAA